LHFTRVNLTIPRVRTDEALQKVRDAFRGEKYASIKNDEIQSRLGRI
jgi:hypothetical protein